MIKKLIPRPVRTRLKFALKRLRYSGTGRVCPICGGHARIFADFGYTLRHDAQCIWCGSLERHRLVWLYLQRVCPIDSFPSTASFLHIAPEPCFEPRFRKSFPGRYITADLLADHVDLAMDVCNIQLPDKSIDILYCSHVLEHVPDDRKAMREFGRILSDGGRALLMVPITAPETFEDPTVTDPAERFRLFGQTDHVRRYGPDFENRLIQAGLKVNKISPRDILSDQEIITMGVSPVAGEIYACTR